MERKTVQDLFGSEHNADPLRLAILGFRSIEQALEAALAEAFGGQLPDELRRTHFNVRVALAVALGLVPGELRGPLGRLKKLRDEFAHGRREDLAARDGRELYAAMRELAPDVDKYLPGFRDEFPPIVLSSFLLLLQEALNASFKEATERRNEQDAAMHLWWERRIRRDPIPALFGEDVDRQRVAELISALSPRERAIFTLRFYGPTTLEEIGRVVDLSRERVRQIEGTIIKNIRLALREDQESDS